MASWVKCTDLKAQAVWVNLDNVTVMTWRDTPQDTEIIFIGGGEVIVRERPEDLTKRSQIDGLFAALHMSPIGTKRTSRHAQPMSAVGGKADIELSASMSAFDPKRTFEVSFLIRQSLMRMTGVPTSI